MTTHHLEIEGRGGLEASGVTLRVAGGRAIVENAELTLRRGQLIALLGPNGAGKTSLLRLLAGESRPSAGEVRLNGWPLADHDPAERARLIGVLPQASSLELAFTVEEVVLLGRLPHGGRSSRRRDREIAHRCLALMGLDAFGARRYTRLSGGERQRVQAARVFAQLWERGSGDGAPGYLLLDEPTAALDLAHVHALMRLVRELTRYARLGALVVLHDLNLAAAYADRVAVMKEGRIVVEGSPAAVLTHETIREVWSVETRICPHPTEPCPLIVTVGAGFEKRIPAPMMHQRRRAFTLIELLIVVAIIAILAAIAVPNFLEAQTRARVARVRTDTRAMATALEAYAVDHNVYPRVDSLGQALVERVRPLTTPVAFLTSIPRDAFPREAGTFMGRGSAEDPLGDTYFYTSGNITFGPGIATPNDVTERSWGLTSGGPDGELVFPYWPFAPTFLVADMHLRFIYDPTNGTTSGGEIFRRGGRGMTPISAIDAP